MFSLFFKECKQIFKSLIYYVFIGAVIAFYLTQYYGGASSQIKFVKSNDQYAWTRSDFKKPEKMSDEEIKKFNEKYKTHPYGYKYAEVPKKVIRDVFLRLYQEYLGGSYAAYPFGIIQHVKLNSEETKKIESALEEVSGKTIKELNTILSSKNNDKVEGFWEGLKIDYGRFKELMGEVSGIIGKGCYYEPNEFYRKSKVEATYEDALKSYKSVVVEDRISNGAARLFCDYMGIALGMFSIFLVVFLFMKDKKSKMSELIYSRQASSFKVILSRFWALVAMIMLPILVLAIISTIQLTPAIKANPGVNYDYLAFLKYSIGWLMPTVMAVAALGMLLTLLTDSFLAIVVQIGWFFYNLNMLGLKGNYPITALMIRFNNSGERDLFIENFHKITINRLFYVGVSIVIVGASIVVFELKRRGNLNGYGKTRKLFKNNKGESKAISTK